jgi:pilus assembly protein Flp/PilA
MLSIVRSFIADESGATAIEYGLIAALVSVAGITALQALGSSLQSVFNTVSSSVDQAVSGV